MDYEQKLSRDPSILLSMYKQLCDKLECPVCLDYLRPGTTLIAMCTNGHILCQNCTPRVCNLADETGVCPQCRCEKMAKVTCHSLAFGFLDVMTACMQYKCKYDTCNTKKVGKVILNHESMCYERPVMCPRRSCKAMVPYYQFLTTQHSCLKLMRAEPNKNNLEQERFSNVWKGIILLTDIFSFDCGRERVSPTFDPWLLLPQDNEEETPMEEGDAVQESKQSNVETVESEPKKTKPVQEEEEEEEERMDQVDKVGRDFKKDCEKHYKMNLNIIESMGGGIVIYVSSFETKQHISKTNKDKQFVLSAFAHTRFGAIGQLAKVYPVYKGNIIKRNDDGIFFSPEDIRRLIFRIDDSLFCTECYGKDSPLPHLHINIKEKIETKQ